MTFKRASFYGTNFDWYAVDADGQIARFDTGYGPMPRRLFQDEPADTRVSDYFQSAPARCLASLSALARELSRRHAANFDYHLDIASRGLFVYDERDHGPHHELCAIPDKPLVVSAVPPEIAQFLGAFVLSNHHFGDADVVNISEVFECVV